MRRREFVTLLSGATVWSLTARAQDLAMPVVGFIGSDTRDGWASRMRGFYEGLSRTGYVERRNVAIEYRWADGQEDRLPGFAADLTRRQVSAIVVPGTVGTFAAKAATKEIPIVFLVGGDPVRLGLVASLDRPGANLTGMFNLNLNLAPTRLQMLHELVPSAALIGLLVDPTNPTAEGIVRNVQATASTLGLQIHVLHATSEREFDSVFATLAQVRAGALMIGTEGFLFRKYEHSLNRWALARSIEYSPRSRRGHCSILIHDLSIDDHVDKSFGVLAWFVVRRHVSHACRIEYRNVGLHSGP